MARPRTVSLIGWFFVVYESVASVAALWGLLKSPHGVTATSPGLLALATRILGVVGGALLLRGLGVARWLLAGCIAYHVLIGALHGPLQFVVHGVLCALLLYLLFRPPVSAWLLEMRRS